MSEFRTVGRMLARHFQSRGVRAIDAERQAQSGDAWAMHHAQLRHAFTTLAIRGLDQRQELVLGMAYGLRLSDARIGRAFDVSETTARRWRCIALRHVRERAADMGLIERGA